MFKAWTSKAEDADGLARALEAHLNEYADEVVSVAYSVSDAHYVLAVYREISLVDGDTQEAAVSVAEQIIDEAQT